MCKKMMEYRQILSFLLAVWHAVVTFSYTRSRPHKQPQAISRDAHLLSDFS